MGGKSEPQAAPPPPQPDLAQNDALIAQMFALVAASAEAPQPPPLPSLPEIKRDPITNWTEKNNELMSKARADYADDTKSRKGRTQTILTSPLLDDEDINVSGPSLIGA